MSKKGLRLSNRAMTENLSSLLGELKKEYRRMSHTHKKFEEEFIIVQSDAGCIDPLIGTDLMEYLDGVLTGDRLERFELHRRRCVACESDLANARSLSAFGQSTRKLKRIS